MPYLVMVGSLSFCRTIECEAEQTAMRGNQGKLLPVVTMKLNFVQPIRQGLCEYFHPIQTS